MLFHSIDFAFFLPIVFLLYWWVAYKNLSLQNLLIVVASYVFYGWWNSKFLLLILLSTVVDYVIALAIHKVRVENAGGGGGVIKNKKALYLLLCSIVVNLGILAFFKYYNFFLDNFIVAFSFLGMKINAQPLHIILPVGISFYTFQTMSYTIDVYRGKLMPTRNFIAFAAFVSFFPQLVAGPIERATHFLPQFYKKRSFQYPEAVDGLRQILWGLFKKVVIADNCSDFVNYIFEHSAEMNGATLLLGAVFFAFQIYGDFSGYADIAIGTARLFGFKLMQNFSYPYFSRDIAEFWRRWHISLSSWFRDYVYIPLGGSRGSMEKKARNIFVIFILSGLWHGANWTFIIWGVLNAFYFLPSLLQNRHRKHLKIVAANHNLPTLIECLHILITFFLVCIAWIFFRADNLTQAFQYIDNMFSASLFDTPKLPMELGPLSYFLIFFLIVEWLGRKDSFALQKIGLQWTPILRYILYLMLTFLIIIFSEREQAFIYFQF